MESLYRLLPQELRDRYDGGEDSKELLNTSKAYVIKVTKKGSLDMTGEQLMKLYIDTVRLESFTYLEKKLSLITNGKVDMRVAEASWRQVIMDDDTDMSDLRNVIIKVFEDFLAETRMFIYNYHAVLPSPIIQSFSGNTLEEKIVSFKQQELKTEFTLIDGKLYDAILQEIYNSIIGLYIADEAHKFNVRIALNEIMIGIKGLRLRSSQIGTFITDTAALLLENIKSLTHMVGKLTAVVLMQVPVQASMKNFNVNSNPYTGAEDPVDLVSLINILHISDNPLYPKNMIFFKRSDIAYVNGRIPDVILTTVGDVLKAQILQHTADVPYWETDASKNTQYYNVVGDKEFFIRYTINTAELIKRKVTISHLVKEIMKDASNKPYIYVSLSNKRIDVAYAKYNLAAMHMTFKSLTEKLSDNIAVKPVIKSDLSVKTSIVAKPVIDTKVTIKALRTAISSTNAEINNYADNMKSFLRVTINTLIMVKLKGIDGLLRVEECSIDFGKMIEGKDNAIYSDGDYHIKMNTFLMKRYNVSPDEIKVFVQEKLKYKYRMSPQVTVNDEIVISGMPEGENISLLLTEPFYKNITNIINDVEVISDTQVKVNQGTEWWAKSILGAIDTMSDKDVIDNVITFKDSSIPTAIKSLSSQGNVQTRNLSNIVSYLSDKKTAFITRRIRANLLEQELMLSPAYDILFNVARTVDQEITQKYTKWFLISRSIGNYMDIIKIKDVDKKITICNNPHIVYQIYGIEALQSMLIESLNNQFGVKTGEMSPDYVTLTAKCMTALGIPVSVGMTGLMAIDKKEGTMEAMWFEQTFVKIMMTAGMGRSTGDSTINKTMFFA